MRLKNSAGQSNEARNQPLSPRTFNNAPDSTHSPRVTKANTSNAWFASCKCASEAARSPTKASHVLNTNKPPD